MNQRLFEKICAWGGVVCITLFFAAFIGAGFLPPLTPSLSAEQVANHYRENVTGIRIGMCLMLLSSIFYPMFTSVISGQMKRIPNLSSTITYTQLACGAFASITFLLPAILFLVTSFRPERNPELTLLMNDFSWIMLVIPWMPFMPQNFAFAFAILSDTQKNPLFPRWLGYLNIWAPISFTPGIFLPFFKSGPFAWDGLFVLWLPGAIFIVWFILTAIMLTRAIDRQ